MFLSLLHIGARRVFPSFRIAPGEYRPIMDELIFLIGFRAAGKTTVGSKLAECLGFEFIDTDQLICDAHQKTVREIVERGGWREFRRLEEKALEEAAGGRRRVVATGGGAVLHRRAWQWIRDRALVVYLEVEPGVLRRRLSRVDNGDASRPSLTGKAVVAEMEGVLGERLPLYREYAHIHIDTGRLSVEETVSQIVDAFTGRESKGEQ